MFKKKEIKYLLIISCIDQVYAGGKKQIISEVIFQENTLFDIRLELLKCNGNKMDEKINTCFFFCACINTNNCKQESRKSMPN